MKLLYIKAHGIMGRTFNYTLGGVNLIMGRNDTGKTAILNSIRLLFVDKLIDQRGKQILPIELASGAGMELAGAFDNGSQIEKSWDQSGRMHCEHGQAFTLPPVLLDSRVYFNLSPGERTRFIFERFQGAIHTTKDQILSEIQNEPMEYATPQTEEHLRTMLGYLRQIKGDTRIFLDDALLQMDESVKGFRELAQRMAKTLRGLTQLDAQYESAPTNVPELKTKVALLRESISAQSEQVGALRKTAQDYQDQSAKAQKLRLQIAATPNHSLKIAELEKLQIDGLKELQSHVSQSREHNQAYFDVSNALTTAKANLRAGNENLTTLMARRNKLLDTGECPFCKQPIAPFPNALIPEIENQKIAVDELGKTLAGLERSASIKLGILQASLQVDSEQAKRQDQLNWIHSEYDRLIVAQGTRKALEAELSGLTATVEPDTSRLLELESALRVATAEAQALDQQLVLAGQASAHKLKLLQTRKEQASAEAGFKVAVMIQEILKATRNLLVTNVINSLLEKTDPFLKDIVNFKLSFHNEELGCWRGPAQSVARTWVPHDLFSGIQQALTYAALSVALAGDSPFKLVLVDEVTRFDADNKALFLAKMAQAVRDGFIDQVFLCDTSFTPYEDVCAIEKARNGLDINLITT